MVSGFLMFTVSFFPAVPVALTPASLPIDELEVLESEEVESEEVDDDELDEPQAPKETRRAVLMSVAPRAEKK